MEPGLRASIHRRFPLHGVIDFKQYADYLDRLAGCGAIEIELRRPDLSVQATRHNLLHANEIIHEKGLESILYTGIFGAENIAEKKHLRQFAQRDKKGGVLGYSHFGERGAMMCPVSPYVDDIIIPKLEDLATFDIEGLFIDIPWVMDGGCYCSNCEPYRANGASKSDLVRIGLRNVVDAVKKAKNIRISVNAGGPTIWDNTRTGAHIENLKGLCDEYLTEWNPYVYGNDPSIITRCIRHAQGVVGTRIWHSSSLTDKKGDMYDSQQCTDLFTAILLGGGYPAMPFNVSPKKLEPVREGWVRALETFYRR